MLLPLDGSRVFFVAPKLDDAFSVSMGVTDGTPSGTTLLAEDISAQRFPTEAILVNGRVVAEWNKDGEGLRFFSIDPATGMDEPITPMGDLPRSAAVGSGGALLRTEDGLWFTDGTAAGTAPLLATTGALDFKTSDPARWGDRAVVVVEDENAGTISLRVTSNGATLANLGALPGTYAPPFANQFATMQDGSLWFYWSGDGANEIWRATSAGTVTRLVAPTLLQPAAGSPADFAASGSYLYYRRLSLSAGAQALYRTDGTEAGTVEVWAPASGESGVVDGVSSSTSQDEGNLVGDGQGGVWFRAEDADSGRKVLYFADGTSAAPVDVPAPPDGVPEQEHNGSGLMTLLGGRLYASGFPYAVEVEGSTYRRIGNASDVNGYSRSVDKLVATGNRIWVGGEGLYYLDRLPWTGGGGGGGGGGTDLSTLAAVTANGTFIGYATGVDDYLLEIYDPSLGIRFALNGATGYVASEGDPGTFFFDAACEEQAYASVREVSGFACGSAPAPFARRVYGVGGDFEGFTQPTQIFEENLQESASLLTPTHYLQGDVEMGGGSLTCEVASAVERCVAPMAYSTIIPTAFATPIAVSAPASP